MTRPAGANEAFIDNISTQTLERLDVLCCPLTEIAGIDTSFTRNSDYDAIFTSSNGVRFAPPGTGLKAWCVGSRTTTAAREAGWNAVCAGENAQALISAVLRAAPVAHLVHFSGTHTRGDIVPDLTAAGLSATRTVVYDQQLLPLSRQAVDLLQNASLVIVPLFSPRTAAHFAALCPETSNISLIFMSEAVRKAAADLKTTGYRISKSPDALSMAACVEFLAQ